MPRPKLSDEQQKRDASLAMPSAGVPRSVLPARAGKSGVDPNQPSGAVMEIVGETAGSSTQLDAQFVATTSGPSDRSSGRGLDTVVDDGDLSALDQDMNPALADVMPKTPAKRTFADASSGVASATGNMPAGKRHAEEKDFSTPPKLAESSALVSVSSPPARSHHKKKTADEKTEEVVKGHLSRDFPGYTPFDIYEHRVNGLNLYEAFVKLHKDLLAQGKKRILQKHVNELKLTYAPREGPVSNVKVENNQEGCVALLTCQRNMFEHLFERPTP